MKRAPAIALALLLGGAACAPAPRVGERHDASEELTPTLSSIQEHVLTPSCATSACHSGNPPRGVPVSMDPGRSYSEMVEVPALTAPLLLVNPYSPETSYLLLRINGGAAQAGIGVATLMPLSAPALPPEQIEAIEQWIANGAAND